MLQSGDSGCHAPGSADAWATPTGPPSFPVEGTMAKGCTKITWSPISTLEVGIGASDDGRIEERAAASGVVEDFEVPSQAMAGGCWDAAGFGRRCGVYGNKVEGKRV